MVNLIVIKVVCVAALAGGVFLFGLLPILFTDVNKGYLSLLVSFSGGVLLGTTLLHLLPEVSSAGDVFKCAVGITTEYPIAELVISMGFILILLIDKVAEEAQTDNDEETRPIISDTERERQASGGSRSTVSDRSVTLNTKLSEPPKTVGAYLLVMALAIHSILEGLAIGLATTVNGTFTLFMAVVIHKICLAFSLGLKLQQDGKSRFQYLTSLAVFALASPTGVIIGIVITKVLQAADLLKAEFLLNALATGTFLYITFLEILGPEFNTHYISQIFKVFAVIVGFTVIGLSMFLFHGYGKVDCTKAKQGGHSHG